MRLRAITCDILSRPVYLHAALSPHTVDVVHLSAGLHAEPLTLRERIQAQVDATPGGVDAVVLAYGLCGGATAGLVARDVPLVLPRAHDCVTIFLGGRARYEAEHERTPGTYWYVPDQIGRGNDLRGWLLGDAARSDEAMATRRDYAERFGESNADYLMATLGEWSARYERGAFVSTGVGDDADDEAHARAEATERGWRFERVAADLSLVRRLLFGEWDADCVVLAPGERLEPSYDEEVLLAVSGGVGTVPAPQPAAVPSRPERKASMNSMP